MKTCPQCNELLGENVDKCFKCGYVFKNKGQKKNRICPKCQKVYYNISYDICPDCHSPLAIYSEKAKRIADSQENNGMAERNIILKFGLEGLDEVDIKSAEWINKELFGNGVIEFASIFSGASNSELVIMSCLRALVEQNWILTRQLNKTNKNLEKIINLIDNKL